MSISIHRPKYHERSKDFPFFLAGIIDGDGHFSRIPQLVICFFEKDIAVAYFLKKMLKYGVVRPVKNKKGVKFIISHREGLSLFCTLVVDKLQHPNKILNYNSRLSLLENFKATTLKTWDLKDNSWFCGFFLADGAFQIKVLDREKRNLPEIRVSIQIDQKEKSILDLIKKTFGGSIAYRAAQKTYIYSSVSFKSAEKVICYFDRFPLMGVKQTQYVLWRKVYVKIMEKMHLKEEGYKTIIFLKEKISSVGKSVKEGKEKERCIFR